MLKIQGFTRRLEIANRLEEKTREQTSDTSLCNGSLVLASKAQDLTPCFFSVIL